MLARGQVLALVLESELVLEPELALVQALVQAPEPRRQTNSQLAVMPAELTIFSFSSKNPPFRFLSAKITLLLKAITPISLI